MKFESNVAIFIQENKLQNVICEMVDISLGLIVWKVCEIQQLIKWSYSFLCIALHQWLYLSSN